jgi:hypothetical protein
MRVVGVALLMFSSYLIAGDYRSAIDELNFAKLSDTYDDAKVSSILEGHGVNLSAEEKSAAAVLITLGALDAEDLANEKLASKKVQSYVAVVSGNHSALMGRIGDASLYHHMADAFDRPISLNDNVFLEVLGEALVDGVLTGYDLRRKGVYDNFPVAHTFIYSQSSLLHMRQLVTLLDSEGIEGWVYITPKVSAFLYRDDWGPVSDAVVTLPGGVRVVQGREVAVLFQFDSGDDRGRFHEVVTRFAKKDKKDEPGLIENAWWQPFYYTDQAFEGFEPISLVVISSDNHEATLTVLEDKTTTVVQVLKDDRWDLRVDRVWVNPPFYRFLNGGYK